MTNYLENLKAAAGKSDADKLADSFTDMNTALKNEILDEISAKDSEKRDLEASLDKLNRTKAANNSAFEKIWSKQNLTLQDIVTAENVSNSSDNGVAAIEASIEGITARIKQLKGYLKNVS